MSKHILLPVHVLDRIIDLLECLEVTTDDPGIRDDCGDVLWGHNVKIQKLHLRDAYSKIIRAASDDDRDDARIGYLRQKQILRDMGDGYF